MNRCLLCSSWHRHELLAELPSEPAEGALFGLQHFNLPLARSDRSPPGGAEASEIDIRQMCAARDTFKHSIAACRQAVPTSCQD